MNLFDMIKHQIMSRSQIYRKGIKNNGVYIKSNFTFRPLARFITMDFTGNERRFPLESKKIPSRTKRRFP